jgi:drug/metabolite transporter (DMT)-like permease
MEHYLRRLGMKDWKPMLAALCVFTLWGFSFLASKVGQTASSPLVILMYRFDIATVVMAFLWLYRRPKIRLKGKNIKGLLLLGLCEPVIYFIGEQYGLKYTNSAFSGVMIAVIPIVTLIMTAIFLKERPAKLQWLFSFLSILGVAAITFMAGGEGQVKPVGVMLLSVSVITGSAYSVISRGISGDFSTYERTFVMQLMGAVFFTSLAVFENRGDFTKLTAPLLSGQFVFAALYLSLGASVAGYLLFNYAVANAPMANVVSLSNLTTVLSVIAGVVFLHEPFSFGSVVALVVILAGIWGVQKTGPALA